MYRKLIVTFLIFVAPIAIIEQNKLSKLVIEESNIFEKDEMHPIDRFFEAIEENSIDIKNCWEDKDLASQKTYCLISKKFFN